MVLVRAPLGQVATQVTGFAVQIAVETVRSVAFAGAVLERVGPASVDLRDGAKKATLDGGWPFACLDPFLEPVTFVPRVGRLLSEPTQERTQAAIQGPHLLPPPARAPPSVV
jgi:hypothetical protein